MPQFPDLKRGDWNVPDDFDWPSVLEAMPEVTADPPETSRRELEAFDTFSFDLWKKDLVCLRHNDQLAVYPRDGFVGAPSAALEVPKFKALFWHQLPKHALRDILEKSTGVRALLPKARFQCKRTKYTLRNSDEKIVARLFVDGWAYHDNAWCPVSSQCRLQALRGYESSFDRLQTYLTAKGLTMPVTGFMANYFQAKSLDPNSFSSKPYLHLHPNEPAREALRRFTIEMFRTARQNELGICEDIDTEFLHDYRVALRKIRSALQRLKSVYPPDFLKPLVENFGNLARRTNRLRDLDVYLLDKNHYFEMTPKALHRGLEFMFEDFEAERQREHAAIKAHLESESYQKQAEQLEAAFAPQQNIPETETSAQPIAEVLQGELLGRYKKLQKHGARINAQTPDERVHQLRIDGKKVRYLLDLAASLLSPKDYKWALGKLKKLQDGLGNFNDYSVQKESLLAYIENHRDHNDIVSVALAIGALVGVLDQKQKAERERIVGLLADFRTPAIRKRFRRIITRKGTSE